MVGQLTTAVGLHPRRSLAAATTMLSVYCWIHDSRSGVEWHLPTARCVFALIVSVVSSIRFRHIPSHVTSRSPAKTGVPRGAADDQSAMVKAYRADTDGAITVASMARTWYWCYFILDMRKRPPTGWCPGRHRPEPTASTRRASHTPHATRLNSLFFS